MVIRLHALQVLVLGALLAPLVLFAQGPHPPANLGPLGMFMGAIILFVESYIIPFIFTLAFLVFIWGMFKYFLLSGANEEGQKNGKQLMFWGVAGIVLMVSLWGLVNVVAQGLGFRSSDIQTLPKIPIPGSSYQPPCAPNC